MSCDHPIRGAFCFSHDGSDALVYLFPFTEVNDEKLFPHALQGRYAVMEMVRFDDVVRISWPGAAGPSVFV